MNVSLEWLKPKYLFALSLTQFFAWLIIVISLSGTYVGAAVSDPLAMINVLFPYFWIILITFVATCFLAFVKKDSPRWLHTVLLVQFGLFLFYTPFLLGSFSWSPDSLWHGGVASYMPSILEGAKYPLTQYAQSYPFSFLITYGAETAFNVDVVTYTLYVFPPVCIAAIATLSYLFISRITSGRTAFLSLLLALPALHYLEPHVSPFATGTVLLFASFLLLTYKGKAAIALNIIVITILVLTHPISPLFLGIYLSAVLIVAIIKKIRSLLTKKVVTYSIKPGVILVLLGFLVTFWAYWTMYEASPNYTGVQAPLTKLLSAQFLTNLFKSVEWTTSGQGFIYPEISQLSLLIYAAFMISVLSILALTIFKFIRHKSVLSIVSVNLAKLFRTKSIQGPFYLRLVLVLMAIGSAAMSYLLFSSSGERFLLGRGLIFFLIMGSVAICTFVNYNSYRKFRIQTAVIFVGVLFLVSTFPIVSYSKESYNTFTPNAEKGLIFLGSLDLSNKTVCMTSSQQLASFADLSVGLELIDFPPNLAVEKPDIIVLRINSYYFMAMRYNMSFTNNSYVQLLSYLENSVEYTEIYSDPEFLVYERSMLSP